MFLPRLFCTGKLFNVCGLFIATAEMHSGQFTKLMSWWFLDTFLQLVTGTLISEVCFHLS